jgi:hypothetical protein
MPKYEATATAPVNIAVIKYVHPVLSFSSSRVPLSRVLAFPSTNH